MMNLKVSETQLFINPIDSALLNRTDTSKHACHINYHKFKNNTVSHINPAIKLQ